MVSVGQIVKSVTVPVIAVNDAINGQEGQYGSGTPSFTVSNIMTFLVTFGLVILAVYLCWTCNINTALPLKILYVLLAIVFHIYYLIYYFVYHVIMGVACV